MFGNTDITNIERLLERIVVNQERMLLCWEEAPADEPEVVEPEVIEPEVIEPDESAGHHVRSDRRTKIFYTTAPLDFLERKIDLATRDGVHCIYIAALFKAVNEGANRIKGSKRPAVSAERFSWLLQKLIDENRVTPVSSKGTGDIGVRIASEATLPPHLVFLPRSDFNAGLKLFVRWN